jgi:hypothetical protein
MALMVASVPEETNRTRCSEGNARRSIVANSTSNSVVIP